MQPIDIHTHDGVADSWLYQPAGVGPWPGVILLPDIKGVRRPATPASPANA